MSQQPNFNYNYRPPGQPHQPQGAQSPQIQQTSPQPPQTLYQQQQMMMNQMRFNPQMMYQMMRGQMYNPAQPPPQRMMNQQQMNQVHQQQQMAAQMQQQQQQQQMQHIQQQHVQQQPHSNRMAPYNYQQYSARMPYQIQQYQQPYKKSSPSMPRAVNISNKPAFSGEPKKPVLPPPKPSNPPAHIPSAKQVGIKLLQPIQNNDPTYKHVKSNTQASVLLKDELQVLFRSMDRKRCFYKFAAEFDLHILKIQQQLQIWYEKQQQAINIQIERHANMSRDVVLYHQQYNISPQKIVKDTSHIGYIMHTTQDKDYFIKKRNSRGLPLKWIGLHDRPNHGRRVKMPLISRFNPVPMSNNTILCPIRLVIDMDGISISDVFTWDVTSNTKVALFAYLLIEDLKYPMHKDVIDRIIEQINTGIEDGGALLIDPTPTTELRIKIKINITIGYVSLEDEFEWDICNKENSPEEFAEILCLELHLGGEFM